MPVCSLLGHNNRIALATTCRKVQGGVVQINRSAEVGPLVGIVQNGVVLAVVAVEVVQVLPIVVDVEYLRDGSRLVLQWCSESEDGEEEQGGNRFDGQHYVKGLMRYNGRDYGIEVNRNVCRGRRGVLD